MPFSRVEDEVTRAKIDCILVPTVVFRYFVSDWQWNQNISRTIYSSQGAVSITAYRHSGIRNISNPHWTGIKANLLHDWGNPNKTQFERGQAYAGYASMVAWELNVHLKEEARIRASKTRTKSNSNEPEEWSG